MKKSIFTFAILLSAIAIITSSCSKDDDQTPAQLDGKYKLSMNGKTVAEGTTEEVGMAANAISLSLGEEFGVLISGVPESVGGEAQITESGSEATVVISGKNLLKTGADEMYFSIEGTVKRTSASTISFEGTCSEMGSSTINTFSGTADSEAFKVI